MDKTNHGKDQLQGYGHLATSLSRISRGSAAFW